MQNKKTIMVTIAFFAVVIFVPIYSVIAQENFDSSTTTDSTNNIIVSGDSQEQCFQMLKNDMAEAGVFEKPLVEMQKMTYQELEQKFSRTYKSLASFGNFELSQPDVEMRIYSFGEQTGFMYPPLSPYPVSTKSEVWDEPMNEFVIVEEYISDSNNKNHFMDCAFIAMGAEDLMSVTREEYLGDNLNISLNKVAEDGSYKSWYSELLAFNREDKPFAMWHRLFVYPKSTQNDYFNKYDVADAYPAHEVESLDVLTSPALITVDGSDDLVSEEILTGAGELSEVTVTVPEVLKPVKQEGMNVMFSKSEYYQAIEAQFPEFAQLLSYRGSLKYEAFKEIISQEQTPEVNEVLGVLYDYKRMASYVLDTKSNESAGVTMVNPEMDELLVIASDADLAIQNISSGDRKMKSYGDSENFFTSLYGIIAIVLFILIIILVVTVLRGRNNMQNNEK